MLEQTRERLGAGGPENLRQRVDQATADLTLVGRLEDIRLKSSDWSSDKFGNRGADQGYADTFRDTGLAKEGEDAETVASRLHASAVNEQLVAAVDDWAAATEDAARRIWLLEIARCADPDRWRDRFRDPAVWRDPIRLEALAKELLDDDKQMARQKPLLLALMGRAMIRAKVDAVPLLAAAQARRP